VGLASLKFAKLERNFQSIFAEIGCCTFGEGLDGKVYICILSFLRNIETQLNPFSKVDPETLSLVQYALQQEDTVILV
jgi:hypothetical protein